MHHILIPPFLQNEILYYAFIDNQTSVPELVVNSLYRENRMLQIRFIEDELFTEVYVLDVVDLQSEKTIHESMLAETPEKACALLLKSLEKDANNEIKRFI